MQVLYAPDEAGKAEATRLLSQQEEGIIINITGKTWCVCGENRAFNEAVCESRQIPIFQAHHLGGTTIVFPGDLSIFAVHHGQSRFGRDCLDAACQYLLRKGLAAAVSHNDLMLFDAGTRQRYKVGSYGSNWVGKLTESVVHFSINSDVKLISEICTKPMAKVPGALSRYGVTAEALLGEIMRERWDD